MKDWFKIASILAALARPVRMWVWMAVIIIIAMYMMITGGKPDASGILFMIVTGMFADMGVNSILRTNEKNAVVKADTAQKTVDKITSPDNTTVIENMNLNNETVNMPKG